MRRWGKSLTIDQNHVMYTILLPMGLDWPRRGIPLLKENALLVGVGLFAT